MLVKVDIESPAGKHCKLCLGNGRYALIDKEDFDRIGCYKWHIRQTRYNAYAVRKKRWGKKEFLIPMHRQIMHCPTEMVVHHINHCGLDNRKCNLLNVTKDQHRNIHKFY